MITSPVNPLDLVTLVNESDEVIGSMDKMEAHRGDAKLHRCVSVYLFHPDTKQLLIQQRATVKIVGADQWANTICGNVRPTESYEQCAYRRLQEELGITTAKIVPIYKFQYHLRCNAEFSEWEMDQVFFGWYDGIVQPNPTEAQAYAFVDWKELLQQSQSAAVLEDEFHTKNIRLKHISLDEITLTPWLVWMLDDKKLLDIIEEKITS